MRLNNSMRYKLLTLVMNDTDFKVATDSELYESFTKVSDELYTDDIKAFYDAHPEFKLEIRASIYMYLKELFTSEELTELGVSGNNNENVFAIYKDGNAFNTWIPFKVFYSWFTEPQENESIKAFVDLCKQNIKTRYLKAKMRKELETFLDNCTTDKQILLTYPQLEKYFNQAGIVSNTGGRALPVPVALTNFLNTHLK